MTQPGFMYTGSSLFEEPVVYLKLDRFKKIWLLLDLINLQTLTWEVCIKMNCVLFFNGMY